MEKTTGSWVELCDGSLPVQAVTDWVRDPSCGATVVFTGSVRDHSPDRPDVTALRYEAYAEWVEPYLTRSIDDTRSRWPEIVRVAALHRIGRLGIGEEAVVVAVGSPHREEAFYAAKFLIDTVKATVPIWKHETWNGGQGWASCNHTLVPSAAQ